MKITIDKSRVMFVPENMDEKAHIEALWRKVVDCVRGERKLVPIGEYSPAKGSNTATFWIEGLEPGEKYIEIVAEGDCTVYCKQCNSVINLKKGEIIPICCGIMMEIVD